MSPQIDDPEAMANSHRLVHLNMSEATRRRRYRELRDAGFNHLTSRRLRDWHTPGFNAALEIRRAIT